MLKSILIFTAAPGEKARDRGTVKMDLDYIQVYVNSTLNMNYSDPEFVYD